MRKISLFIFHILVSTMILFLAFKNNDGLISRFLILMMISFLGLILWEHFYEVKNLDKKGSMEKQKVDLENVKIILGASLSAAITWYINHEMGYGAIIANGFVGVVVGILFSPKKAGAFYAASFVGMSGLAIVPSMGVSAIIGLVAGVIIVSSQEVYAGIGGKGGTMIAFSTQLVRGILHLFI